MCLYQARKVGFHVFVYKGYRETSPDLSNNYNHTLPVLHRLDRIYNANFTEIYIFVLNGLVVPCEIMCVKEQRKTKQQLYCRNSSKIQKQNF
jgi:hypothetical protein